MNRFNISMLCSAIFLAAMPAMSLAQASTTGESYYFNPRTGISATVPTPYSDDAVASKSEDLTVQLTGEVGDTVVPKDSIKGTFNKDDYYDYEYSARINRFHRDCGWNYYDDYYTNLYWYTGDPFYWGTSIYWGFGWYPYGYYGWSPYWSVGVGIGWNPYWGWSSWAYGGAFWDPFWPYGGWGWGGPDWDGPYHDDPHDGWGGAQGGHGHDMGMSQRVIPGQTTRNGAGLSTGTLGSRRDDNGNGLGGNGNGRGGNGYGNGVSRRGGVDINSNTRNISTGSLGSRNDMGSTAGRSSAGTRTSLGINGAAGRNVSGSSTYRKPASVADSRSNTRSATRTYSTGSRDGNYGYDNSSSRSFGNNSRNFDNSSRYGNSRSSFDNSSSNYRRSNSEYGSSRSSSTFNTSRSASPSRSVNSSSPSRSVNASPSRSVNTSSSSRSSVGSSSPSRSSGSFGGSSSRGSSSGSRGGSMGGGSHSSRR